MAALYKQRCMKCNKNYVAATSRDRYIQCYDCQKDDLNKPIKDPVMKKMFDLPEEYYKTNSFLRSIKSNYLRFGKLTDKQIEAFKKAIEKIKAESV